MKYELCGFPIWKGKIKSRQAKSLAREYSIIYFSSLPQYRKLKVGDIINDCSGFNKYISEIQPEYYKKQNGYVLVDIIFVTHDTGHCSLTDCGVEVNISRTTIEAKHLEFIEDCIGIGGKNWGSPEDSWDERTRARIAMYDLQAKTIRSGGHICDENGFLLDEFKIH